MSMIVSFRLDRADLEGVQFLLVRDHLHLNGDLESGFFDGLSDLHRHPDGLSLAQCLDAALTNASARILVISENPALVLDDQLPDRIAAAITGLAPLAPWAVASAGGVGPDGRETLSLYASEHPAIPHHGLPVPLVDPVSDLYMLDAEFTRALAPTLATCNDAIGLAVALEGYLAGRVSLHLPGLIAGINGALMPPPTKCTETIGARFHGRAAGQTLVGRGGPFDIPGDPGNPVLPHLGEGITAAIAARSDAVSLSIVTRTRFERMHLLERLLASLCRARREDAALEVILTSDAAPGLCARSIATLRLNFPQLTLHLVHNADRPGPSRVGNLLAGIDAARNDYVLILDDDDYVDIFAFDLLRPALFAGARPVIATRTELHQETWSDTPSGRWVLTESKALDPYPAAGLWNLFHGSNKLPICALVIPRESLVTRLRAFDICHDLSEDYALFLLLLTDPALGPIRVIEQTLCHVSIRGHDNSVTMTDRRPWVRDITRHLSDLTADPNVTGIGQWALLVGTGAHQPPLSQSRWSAMTDTLAAMRRENTLLHRETARLQSLIARQDEGVR